MMTGTDGYKQGDRVRAFHPLRFGVVNTGTVVKVGRVWVHVDFGPMLGGIRKVHPSGIVGKEC